MKYFFDTEFIDDGITIYLISIGIISEKGRTYYAESSECDLSTANDWVIKNVVPHLRGVTKTRKTIADEIRIFVGENPEFWGYYADYDWVVLCQLYGPMINLPATWPMFCLDVKQLAGKIKLPQQMSTEHNALNDAIWTKQAYEFLIK